MSNKANNVVQRRAAGGANAASPSPTTNKKTGTRGGAAAAKPVSRPGFFVRLIGLLIQFVLLVVVLAACTIAYIYFSPNIGGRESSYDPDVWFPIKEDESFFDYSIVSYHQVGLLNVLTAGNSSGTMLLFLHGFPETALLSWHHQIEHFSKQGYFVVAPDLRGYNNSAKPTGAENYLLSELGADVIKIIDHFHRENAVVIGHDWGAAVAWYLGMNYSHRLDRLIILNVPHPQVMQDTLRSSWTQLKNSWYILFFQVPWVPEAKIAKDNFRWLTGALCMSPPGTFSRSTVKLYHEAWSVPGATTAMLNWYRAIPLARKYGINSNMRVPLVQTLMIWGDQDTALDSSMAQPSIDMCDHGKLEFVHGASHWVQHEQPERVNQLIEEFLAVPRQVRTLYRKTF